jgi:hypothetical protein
MHMGSWRSPGRKEDGLHCACALSCKLWITSSQHKPSDRCRIQYGSHRYLPRHSFTVFAFGRKLKSRVPEVCRKWCRTRQIWDSHMKCVIFWGVTPYSPAEVHRRDRERDACCFSYWWLFAWFTFLLWRWRQYVTSKRQSTSFGIHGVTSLKIVLVIENGHTALWFTTYTVFK